MQVVKYGRFRNFGHLKLKVKEQLILRVENLSNTDMAEV